MTTQVRISLVLEESELKQLDDSLPVTGIADRNQLFAEALKLFGWAWNAQQLRLVLAEADPERNILNLLPIPPLNQGFVPGSGTHVFNDGGRLARIDVYAPLEKMRNIDRGRDAIRHAGYCDILSRCKIVYLAALGACANQLYFCSFHPMARVIRPAEFEFLDRARAYYAH
jgi:hypothetical protein